MWREWTIILLSVQAVSGSINPRASGQLYVFGKIGLDSDAVPLGDPHADFLENHSETFIGIGTGDNMAVGLTSDGVAHRFDDLSEGTIFLSQVTAPDGRFWCQICRGVTQTVAVTCDGEAFTWGVRRPNPMPDEPPQPMNIPFELDLGGERVLQISCGQNHTVFLTEERHVYTLGMASQGRLGIGPLNEAIRRVDLPSAVSSIQESLEKGDRVCSVEAGGSSTFAITEMGKMYAWGVNDIGQLGTGEYSPFEDTPVLVESDPEFLACEVAAGNNFVIGFDDKGDIFTWGSGSPNITRFSSAPSTKAVLSVIESRTVQVAAGEFHAAILQDDGTVLTYGYNRFGQLGVVIDVPMPTDPNPEFEPDSPIWTLSPKVVEYLQGKNVSSVFAAGNYTAALQNVQSPHECPCARGGRPRRSFFSWSPSLGAEGPPMMEKPGKVPPIQPIRPASSRFEPVSPFVGKKRIEAAPALPGELAVHVEPREMDEMAYPQMMDEFKSQPLELPKRAATFYFYPEGSNDAKAWEDGAEKGVEQKLFGRHITADGYFYGDYDEEVANAEYKRQAIMKSSRQDLLMPEKGEQDGPAGHHASGTENIGNLVSLSLQDVHAPRMGGDEAMMQSTLASVRELKDTLQPVDFSKIHVASPEKIDLEGFELIQEAARRPVESALEPQLLD